MGTIKKIVLIIINNLLETFIVTGTVFLFIGVFLIYKPMAYIVVGLISMFLALLIYKNQ